jgi:PAS domain S-box-containing protein
MTKPLRQGPQLEQAADETRRLRGCINDLIGILALPAVWNGHDPAQIVSTLLDVLVRILRLDFAFVRVGDPIGSGPIEMVRYDHGAHLKAAAQIIAETLTEAFGDNPRKWPPHARSPFGDGSLSIVPIGTGHNNEIDGVIVAGSHRDDFPWQTETVVLSVAANQAAVGLASARAHEQERRRNEAELERQRLHASQELLIQTSHLYRELQNREAKIRRLVDANILGIFIWNLDGDIIEANEAFLDMLQYEREEFVSGRLRWNDLTPAEWRERDERTVAELRSTGTFQPVEKEYFRKDGSRIPVLIGGALFEESRSEGVAFVLDLTERKQAEEALRALEADFAHMNRVSMMGELAASLSHEITQPIASARNNARAALNFMDMQPTDLGEVRDALACVVSDVDRAGGIMDRIRDHIRKAPPRLEHFDLNVAINEVIVLAQSAILRNGVSVQPRLADGLRPIDGDRVQLQQVVLNLVLNAVEAMGSAESVDRELLIRTSKDHAGVLVAVRDTGPGIDQTHLERVFEAFYTTKSTGVGMGLAICRSIIAAHGGRLWAEANEPRGAVFQFTLPGADLSS